MDKNFISRCLTENKFKVILYAVLGLAVWFIAFIIPYITGRYVDSLIYNASKDTKTPDTLLAE